jgi:NAD(P)-dependent dehydrogenase (short-subunit alcohol dehydrogenase family)
VAVRGDPFRTGGRWRRQRQIEDSDPLPCLVAAANRYNLAIACLEGASIILNSSVVGSKGLPIDSVYSATKAAIRSFARTWTTDLKARRIRANEVSPGSIDTPGLSGLLASPETGQQRLKMISNNVPLGRLGPDEIAKAVVFLASDDASYITGAELFVDGGFAQVWAERPHDPDRHGRSEVAPMKEMNLK